jgi:hypothetical protein
VRPAAVLAILVALAAPARAGGAEDLAEARRLKQQLDYRGALAATLRAIAAGDHDPPGLRAAYALAGELAAGLGDDDAAVEHFVHLLVLDPTATLPAGTSPKITAPFAEARAQAHAAGALTARLEETGDGVALVVERDPLGMVAGARLRWGDRELRATGAGRLELAVPAGVRFEAALVDRHGNALFAAPGERPAGRPDPGDRPPSRRGAPPWAHPAPWAGVAAVAGGVAAVAALRVRSAQREWDRLRDEDGVHDFSRLRAVEERGRRNARVANVALAAAAVAGTAAVALLARDSGRTGGRADGRAGRPAPTLALSPDGGVLGIAGRF